MDAQPTGRLGEKGLPIPEGVEPGCYDDPNSWASGLVGVNVASDGHFYDAKTGVFVAGGKSANKNGANGKNQKKINTFKAALVDPFEAISGIDALAQWGRNNRTKFYQLCGKMIPLDVKIEAAHKHLHVVMSLPPPQIDGACSTPPAPGEHRTRQLADGSTIVEEFTVTPGTPTELPEPREVDLIPVANQPTPFAHERRGE